MVRHQSRTFSYDSSASRRQAWLTLIPALGIRHIAIAYHFVVWIWGKNGSDFAQLLTDEIESEREAGEAGQLFQGCRNEFL